MEDSLSPEYWSPPALTLLSESLATSLTLWVSAPPPPPWVSASFCLWVLSPSPSGSLFSPFSGSSSPSSASTQMSSVRTHDPGLPAFPRPPLLVEPSPARVGLG